MKVARLILRMSYVFCFLCVSFMVTNIYIQKVDESWVESLHVGEISIFITSVVGWGTALVFIVSALYMSCRKILSHSKLKQLYIKH